jgi:hypothetical protein
MEKAQMPTANVYPDNATFYFTTSFNGTVPPGLAAAAQPTNGVWNISALDTNGNNTPLSNIANCAVSASGQSVKCVPVSGAAGSVVASFSFSGLTGTDTASVSLPIATAVVIGDAATAPAGETYGA